VPVGERQAQALQIGMPGPDLGFDGHDLAPAAGDSSCLPVTFLGYLSERTPVPIEYRIHPEVVPLSLAD